ncbi:Deoxynucleoside kinase [Paragonimus heterotremus]|uniref:Deoxynucleoside kinase n=1 Tax=Paragonimus heterotremus TaxID=100268 RepID=A0A8J4T315_9TREM|nr:Deoxynucleoside kinase [Paragonimus heterotremus]
MACVCFRSVALRKTRVSSLRCVIRTLKLAESGEVVYAKPPPFDYMGQSFSLLRSLRDPTYARLNENSKVIVVEGNICSGKSHLASRLAKYFDLNYFPDPTEDDIYLCKNHNPPFDLRSHNALLPDFAKYYTCEMFWNEPDLINKGKPLYLQFQFFARRHFNYVKALCTLFNTGRGFVLDHSPFSEIAFSDALHQSGYMSERACRWFNQSHGLACRYIWKPHLVIYVKATNQQIRERLKKRNIPWEVNARNLTDKFLDTYANTLEKSYLARMSRYSEIFTVDGSNTDVYDEDDIRIIAQKLTELDLTGAHKLRDDYKLIEWRAGLYNDRTKINARAKFSNSNFCFTEQFKNLIPPMDMHEFRYNYDARELQFAALRMDPRTRFPPSFNPRYNSMLNILFNPFNMKRNFERDLPKDYLWL